MRIGCVPASLDLTKRCQGMWDNIERGGNRPQMARGCPRLLSSVENKRSYPVIDGSPHNLSQVFSCAWFYDDACKFGTTVKVMPHAAQIPITTCKIDQKARLRRELAIKIP
jgi:hypothetical protein